MCAVFLAKQANRNKGLAASKINVTLVTLRESLFSQLEPKLLFFHRTSFYVFGFNISITPSYYGHHGCSHHRLCVPPWFVGGRRPGLPRAGLSLFSVLQLVPHIGLRQRTLQHHSAQESQGRSWTRAHRPQRGHQEPAPLGGVPVCGATWRPQFGLKSGEERWDVNACCYGPVSRPLWSQGFYSQR